MKTVFRLTFEDNSFFANLPAISSLLLFYRRSISVALYAITGISSALWLPLICMLSIGLFAFWIVATRYVVVDPICYLPLILMLALYMISLFFAPNEYGNAFFREFLLYCLSGAIIISTVREYKAFIKMYCWFSFWIFIICAPLPFLSGSFSYHGMSYFESGMVYGDWVVCPCFFGLYLLRKQFDRKIMIVLEMIDLFLVALFANRTSLLSVMLFVMLYELIIQKRRDKKVIYKWILIFLVGGMTFLFMGNILQLLQSYLSNHDITSRTLQKSIILFSENDYLAYSYIVSGRDQITRIALELLKENALFGIGVGTFTVLTGIVYTHNIVTDALLTFGIFGGSLILFFTGKAIVNTFKRNEESLQIVLLVLFILCFPRLIFSKTFVNDVPYWMFVVFALGQGNKKIQETPDA